MSCSAQNQSVDFPSNNPSFSTLLLPLFCIDFYDKSAYYIDSRHVFDQCYYQILEDPELTLERLETQDIRSHLRTTFHYIRHPVSNFLYSTPAP